MNKAIDWAAIEPHWRAGIKSKLELSKEFGVSRAAMDKHFDKAGIARDLIGKIRQRAAEVVAQDAVTPKVAVATNYQEQEVVEANAQLQATVMRDHRRTLKRSRDLLDKLLAELELVTDNQELFERLGDFLLDEANEQGTQDKRLEALAKVLSMPTRVDSLRKLIEAMKNVIVLERDVFGISADVAPKPYEDLTPEQIKARIAFLQTKAVARTDGVCVG